MSDVEKVKVTSTVDILKGKEDKKTIEVEKFETDPVYVKRQYSHRLNLGDFNSFEAKVGLAMPCYREEISNVDEAVQNWVQNKLQNVIKTVKKNLKGDN